MLSYNYCEPLDTQVLVVRSSKNSDAIWEQLGVKHAGRALMAPFFSVFEQRQKLAILTNQHNQKTIISEWDDA